MRTDAVMINLAEGDKMHKRMDRPNESIDSSSPGFAMHSSPRKGQALPISIPRSLRLIIMQSR